MRRDVLHRGLVPKRHNLRAPLLLQRDLPVGPADVATPHHGRTVQQDERRPDVHAPAILIPKAKTNMLSNKNKHRHVLLSSQDSLEGKLAPDRNLLDFKLILTN